MLQKRLARQSADHRRQRQAWRREKARLLRQVRTLQLKARAARQLQKDGVFSDSQITRIATKRRVSWTASDIANAIGLRCLSRRAYGYVQSVLKIPLPSKSTLCRWTSNFRMTPGIMDAAVRVLDAAIKGMDDPLDRICVISFDEVSLDARFAYDQAEDQLMAASKMQVLMVRGLCRKWKQPFFHGLDVAMTLDKLTEVIVRLEELGLEVAAAVSDMHPMNEDLWKKAGVTYSTKTTLGQSWIKHPADDNR